MQINAVIEHTYTHTQTVMLRVINLIFTNTTKHIINTAQPAVVVVVVVVVTVTVWNFDLLRDDGANTALCVCGSNNISVAETTPYSLPLDVSAATVLRMNAHIH